MNRRDLLGLAVTAAFASRVPGAAAAVSPQQSSAPQPPIARKQPKTITQLGRTRVDDYAWLKDPQWKTVWRDPTVLRPEIRAHLEAENRYADAMLEPTKPLQAELLAAMQRRMSDEKPSPPQPEGPWAYYEYFAAGSDHPVHARRPKGGGVEQVLLDVDERARGKAYYRAINAQHSPDHTFFAWAEDVDGAERYQVRVRDLKSGEVLASAPQDAFGDFVFSPDSQWIFWTWRDEFSRPAKIFRRPTRGGEDVLVYEEKDPAMYMTVGRTESNGFVTIHLRNPDQTEVWLIPAATPTSPPRIVEPRRSGVQYSVSHWDDRLVILTNADGATDFKLMTADPERPARSAWKEWVPHRPGRYIVEMRAFADHFVRVERAKANLQVVITQRGSQKDQELAFDEVAYQVELEPQQAYASQSLRLVYETPRAPKQWLSVDLASGRRLVLQTQPVGGDFDPSRYLVQRIFAPASDGESVPVTVLMKRGTALDRSAPLLLYAYGSYGISSEAGFSIPALALVDRGWIYAIAHVRGGSENGRRWFLDGRHLRKRNTFTDYIACAEHLCAKGYTRPKRIVAHGLSAGGLLMGAIANMRPDLWAAVIAQVPFVDMLNTMSDAEHPLVPMFRPDWGDPLANAQDYDYIASISPYENVRPQPYPSILATTAVRDDRVGYWEPAKWIAALREKNTGSEPILFRIDMIAGHQGGGGRSDQLELMALFYGYAQWTVDRLAQG